MENGEKVRGVRPKGTVYNNPYYRESYGPLAKSTSLLCGTEVPL